MNCIVLKPSKKTKKGIGNIRIQITRKIFDVILFKIVVKLITTNIKMLFLKNMVLDTLIIGGGVSGMQCALVLGSAKEQEFAKNKKIAIIMHQKASHLQIGLYNNVLGLAPKTLGKDVLIEGKKQLSELYPEVAQIAKEKVLEVLKITDDTTNEFYQVKTNKNTYTSKIVVIALNYAKPFTIKGLEKFEEPHRRANPAGDRIQLKNNDHLIEEGLYCCGTIAGWRSQFAIAAGSGASVGTDILTIWNNNSPTNIHDKA